MGGARAPNPNPTRSQDLFRSVEKNYEKKGARVSSTNRIKRVLCASTSSDTGIIRLVSSVNYSKVISGAA